MDGPEIEYFRRFVEAGQPALDVACGTGRSLVPYLRAGLDVDGCDISPDMLAHAGLADMELRAGYRDAPPSAGDDFVVFLARKAETS